MPIDVEEKLGAASGDTLDSVSGQPITIKMLEQDTIFMAGCEYPWVYL